MIIIFCSPYTHIYCFNFVVLTLTLYWVHKQAKFCSTSQPLTYTISQPLNLSTSQPLNLSIFQPLKISIPLKLSTSQPLNPSISQPLNWWFQHVNYFIDRIVSQERLHQCKLKYLRHDKQRQRILIKVLIELCVSLDFKYSLSFSAATSVTYWIEFRELKRLPNTWRVLLNYST